jgi:hypothetical protein
MVEPSKQEPLNSNSSAAKKKVTSSGWAWWSMLVILGSGMKPHEDPKFKASLGYMARP